MDLTYKRILIAAPHPDDEVFGCSGLIQKSIKKGSEVSILFITSGNASHENCCTYSKEFISNKRKEIAIKINRIAGLEEKNLFFLSLTDGKVGEDESFSPEAISTYVKNINPDLILIPNPLDLHVDHVATYQIIKQIKGNHRTLLYCTWFWYYLPFKNFLSVSKNPVCSIKLNYSERQIKNKLIKLYFKDKCNNNVPYSGKLPAAFFKIFSKSHEMFFCLNENF